MSCGAIHPIKQNKVTPSTSAKLMTIKSASFQLVLDEEDDDTHFRVNVNIKLSETDQNGGYIYLKLPTIVQKQNIIVQSQNLKTKGSDCTSSREKLLINQQEQAQDQILLNCPAYTQNNKINISYEGAWSDVSFYQQIKENNRLYRLLHIPPQYLSSLFVAYEYPTKIPYDFTIQVSKDKPIYLIGTGHNKKGNIISMTEESSKKDTHTHKDHRLFLNTRPKGEVIGSKKEQIAYRWKQQRTDTALPLFFTLGDWDVSSLFQVDNKYPMLVLSGYGSSSYSINGQNFHQVQRKLIRKQSQILLKKYPQFLPTQSPLIFITHPGDPNFNIPNLEQHGIIFMPEAWFYRQEKAALSQPILERTLLSANLLLTCIKQFIPKMHWLAYSIAEYLSVQAMLDPELTKKSLHENNLESPLYAHNQIKRYIWILPTGKEYLDSFNFIKSSINENLDELYKQKKQVDETRLLSHKLRSVFDMLDVSLSNVSLSVKTSFERLFLNLSLNNPNLPKIQNFQAFLQRMNQINPTLKASIESYMLQTDLPLIKVKWQAQKQKENIQINFTLSQKAMHFTHIPKKYLQKKLWTLPVCLKWGQKEADPIETCVLLEHEQQRFKIRLPQKPIWVHPNIHQKGLYYWSLDQQDYQKLFSQAQLNHAEWSSLVDLTLSLVLAQELEVETYLNTLEKFALRSFNPITLSLLFEHFNHVVHFFGSSKKGDLVSQWVSAILQGVMMSEETRFNRPPLSHLTQLQLLQWEHGDSIVLERGVLSKRESKNLKKFLRDESSYDPLESGKDDFDVSALQYPLLLKAHVGNKKLWQKIYDKFLSSSNQTLIRIVCLQALAQFHKASLLKNSLNLLKVSNTSLLSLESDALQKIKAEAEESAGDEPSKESSMTPEMTQDSESLTNSIALKTEDARILIKSIKSATQRRTAWQWLKELMSKDQEWEQSLIGLDQLDIRYALIEWAQALCDPISIKSLAKDMQLILGHDITKDAQAQQVIYHVKRCIQMRSYRDKVSAWFKKRL